MTMWYDPIVIMSRSSKPKRSHVHMMSAFDMLTDKAEISILTDLVRCCINNNWEQERSPLIPLFNSALYFYSRFRYPATVSSLASCFMTIAQSLMMEPVPAFNCQPKIDPCNKSNNEIPCQVATQDMHVRFINVTS